MGTDVRLAGIKIGTVSDLTLDPKTYLVTVHMNIRDDVKIPVDSSLMVTSSGLLGSPYISITPGGDDKMLAAGGMIQNGQGSVDLMGLIGRFATHAAGGIQAATTTAGRKHHETVRARHVLARAGLVAARALMPLRPRRHPFRSRRLRAAEPVIRRQRLPRRYPLRRRPPMPARPASPPCRHPWPTRRARR